MRRGVARSEVWGSLTDRVWTGFLLSYGFAVLHGREKSPLIYSPSAAGRVLEEVGPSPALKPLRAVVLPSSEGGYETDACRLDLARTTANKTFVSKI